MRAGDTIPSHFTQHGSETSLRKADIRVHMEVEQHMTIGLRGFNPVHQTSHVALTSKNNTKKNKTIH